MKARIHGKFRTSRRPSIYAIGFLLALILFQVFRAAPAQTPSRDTLLDWMNAIAQMDLQRRSQAIRAVHTAAEAEQRRTYVRSELLKDLGGLPNYNGPLNARITGEIRTDSYTIEKVIYESLPGFYVTANLYRPNASGRYPAVLLQAGHTQEGKPENQRIAANLAMKGFVVLCFDPIGQGERVQTWSRQSNEPLAGWSVPEHILMDAQSQLIGQGLARYFIWDAMRSLDYLASRPEVDSSRIGAAGCSGGGALTTFIGALDPRVKAVVPACYPSSFQVVFPTTASHGEMAFPHFLAGGLDIADFVEMSAPKPWLLEATEADQFGFSRQGVELVYREAQDWYHLYHARDNVAFKVGPGTHGMPRASREALYQWMIRWLKNGDGDFREQPVPMFSDDELRVTTTGHVEDEPNNRKLFQLLRDDLRAEATNGTAAELEVELKNLRIPTDGSAPSFKLLNETRDAGVTEQNIRFESEPGISLDATLYLPSSPGRKPAVVLVRSDEHVNGTPLSAMAQEMAKLGRVVLEMEPRTSGLKNTEGSYTGDWMTDLQANLIGRNLPAMRAHDILRGVDLLRSRDDVDPGSIRGAARGVAGIWLLLAAAADSRLSKIWIDGTPYSLRSALDNSMTTGLWDAVVPNFILHWDLRDLVKAIGIRQVFWTDPTNWMHGIVALGPAFHYRYVEGDLTDEKNVQDDAFIREFLN
jgi:dienelactone hydrolase